MRRAAARGRAGGVGASLAMLSLAAALGGCGVDRKWGSATTWGALGGAAVGGAAGAGIEAGRGMDDASQLGRGAAIGIGVGAVIGGLAGHFLFDPPVASPPPPPPPPEAPSVPVERTIVIRFDQVRFGFGTSTVEPHFQAALDKAADELLAEPGTRVVVEGHTDDVGDEAYNNELGLRRAEAVRDYLVARGVAAERLSVRSFGKSRPVASNDTEEGRALNRRVELHITNGAP